MKKPFFQILNRYSCFTDTISVCRNGTYGIDCAYNCSGNCESNNTCDKTTGTCSECAPGWKNQYCNKSKKT